MSRRRRHGLELAAGCTVAIAALFLGTGIPAVADPGEPSPRPRREVPPEMLASMQRDLGLTADEARARISNEYRAGAAEPGLRKTLGGAYAGAWVSGNTAELTVATTDAEQSATITAGGAKAAVVKHSLNALTEAKRALDSAAAERPPTAEAASAWYVDVKTNSVVVQSARPDEAAAFVAASGADRQVVRVVESPERPGPLYDLRGGEAYYINDASRCSIGFSVAQGDRKGFVTAGHCGDPGDTTTGSNRVAQGTFQGSSFPGNDYAWVSANADWAPRPWVVGPEGSDVTVDGSQEAPVGSSVCRSGSTTGWHCGTIQQHDTSVQYPQGTVSGVTRTNVCAEPGDSGGAFISGSEAQGVTSGGSGNCTVGGTTYYQPVNPVLTAYGLTLTTG
ncbi:alpha-lytic protease prodomain-containing protein [Streptomyces hygroscopicus subsp. hygroscopicus]|uniref:S1 family peptidase n=1 Tax=Streptomyces TaxID=1883 RepID=UPI001C65B196|nr:MULTISPECIES: S1 family peptidase [Streptomyces]MBW8087835.1 alpha-lytic protease prodomain-containing protein [Streptomyces hygroscopicus subsp. hygroscopicus]MCO8306529.1 S1 family peptidase [Streptomyces sp. RKCA744]